eukprot:1177074-Prorocentrum_minimum.AAC.1
MEGNKRQATFRTVSRAKSDASKNAAFQAAAVHGAVQLVALGRNKSVRFSFPRQVLYPRANFALVVTIGGSYTANIPLISTYVQFLTEEVRVRSSQEDASFSKFPVKNTKHVTRTEERYEVSTFDTNRTKELHYQIVNNPKQQVTDKRRWCVQAEARKQARARNNDAVTRETTKPPPRVATSPTVFAQPNSRQEPANNPRAAALRSPRDSDNAKALRTLSPVSSSAPEATRGCTGNNGRTPTLDPRTGEPLATDILKTLGEKLIMDYVKEACSPEAMDYAMIIISGACGLDYFGEIARGFKPKSENWLSARLSKSPKVVPDLYFKTGSALVADAVLRNKHAIRCIETILPAGFCQELQLPAELRHQESGALVQGAPRSVSEAPVVTASVPLKGERKNAHANMTTTETPGKRKRMDFTSKGDAAGVSARGVADGVYVGESIEDENHLKNGSESNSQPEADPMERDDNEGDESSEDEQERKYRDSLKGRHILAARHTRRIEAGAGRRKSNQQGRGRHTKWDPRPIGTLAKLF